MQHEINSFVLVEKREASVFVGGRCRNLAKILIVRADRIGSDRPVKMLRMRSEDFLADERV